MSSSFRTDYYPEYHPEYLVYLLNANGDHIGMVFVSANRSEGNLDQAAESIAMERFQPARAKLAIDERGNPIMRMVAYQVSSIEPDYSDGPLYE